ncbi:hypothetical protein BTS2_2671 [Bacillus sp. TS-2]|nr:hypothetical protein BTS2_2671 [Bacillus sp. TS-2]
MKQQLKRAISENKIIVMIYLDQKGNFSKRKVKVLKLHHSYFIGYCYYRQQKRLFAIEQILSIEFVQSKIS